MAWLDALKAEVVDIMLFLKSVERIDVLIWEGNESRPQLLSSCYLANPTAQMRQSRFLYVQASKVTYCTKDLYIGLLSLWFTVMLQSSIPQGAET